jgi:hypothetical protein
MNGSNIYVVWEDTTSGHLEIYFRRSVDAGGTWEKSHRLTNYPYPGGSFDPAIAVNGSNIYVVWWGPTPGGHDYDIYFRRSVDAGNSWEKTMMLTHIQGHSHYPAIAVTGSNIYVVWQNQKANSPMNHDIYFKRSVDYGVNWTVDKRLTNNAGASYYPAIAVEESNIYVVWKDDTPGNREIYFKRSVDGGSTWNPIKRLTKTSGNSDYPNIAVNGANIYVIWRDDTTRSREIYFKKSFDGGSTWKRTKQLTNSKPSAIGLSMAIHEKNISIAWGGGIYLKRSVDGGSIWKKDQRLTNNSSAYYPALAMDGSNIHIVWQDQRFGSPEIYYKKGSLD